MNDDVYRDGYLHVRREPCERCLLGARRLVGAERARELIRDSRAQDGSTFICHKHQISDEPAAICFTWFERFADEDWILRLAKHQDIVRYV